MWPFIRNSRQISKADSDRAARYNAEGIRLSDQIMDRVKGCFFAECLIDPDLAKFAADGGRPLHLAFETQFLWGFFHEYVQSEDFPTGGYDRIKLHLMQRLMTFHGYDIKGAAAQANSVEDLFNRDDPLFRELSELGMRSFNQPVDDAMIIGMRAIQRCQPSVFHR
jgi:hypothetical protein